MLSTLTVVSFFFVIAWIQQHYLNRLIAADIEYLKSVRRQQLAHNEESRRLAQTPDAPAATASWDFPPHQASLATAPIPKSPTHPLS